MQLSEIRNSSQFDDFYKEHGLTTIEQKIAYLREEMDVLLIRFEDDFSREDELFALQRHVLPGWDGRCSDILLTGDGIFSSAKACRNT